MENKESKNKDSNQTINQMSEKELKLKKIKNIVYKILYILFFVSVVYAIYKAIITPESFTPKDIASRSKTDYILMTAQCFLGLLILQIPKYLNEKKGIEIPIGMQIMYFIFLYMAIFLGEVRNFYFKISFWDDILHFFSIGMFTIVGFWLFFYLNKMEKIRFKASPFFIVLFAFCFAMTCAVLWEIYEFLADGILNTNMQKFKNWDGTEFVGREALVDTMQDLIVGGVSSFLISVYAYFNIFAMDKKEKEKKKIENTIRE